MTQLEIINKFANGELKEGDKFVLQNYVNDMPVGKLEIKVGFEGGELICYSLTANDKPICTKWVLYKHHLNTEGYTIK